MNARILFPLLVLALLIVSCAPAQVPQAPARQPEQAPPVVEAPPVIPQTPAVEATPKPESTPPAQLSQVGTTDAPRDIFVEAFQFGYEPSEIHVKNGETIRIHLKTRDVGHSFSAKEVGINVRAFPDKDGVQTMTINKDPGTYGARCNVECGSGHSKMNAKVVVE